MNILVIGALGHLGVNFIISQCEHYDTIVAIDKNSYCSQKKELIAPYVSKFIEADITKVNLFDVIIDNDIDFVLNAGASTHVDRSYLLPDEFIHDNIIAVKYIMEAISKFPNINFIHMSTDEVYGDDYTLPRKESDALNPTNFYSSTKASADMLILSYIKNYNSKAIALRPNNLIGPYQYPDKIVPLFYKQVKNQSVVKIHNGGTQKRNFICTRLVCQIISELFFKSHRWPSDNPFINIACDEQRGISILEILLIIKKKLKILTGKVEFVNGRLYNDKHYAVDNSKLKELLHDSYILDSLKLTSEYFIQNFSA